MRTVDTETLKSLAPGGAGPWLTGDGTLVRTASGRHPISTQGEAQEMLAIYRACAAAAGTPDGHEVVRVRGGYGVVVDYVAGLGMEAHIVIGSYSPEEAGRAMGGLLRGLHGARVQVGRDWNGAFCGYAGMLASLLPDGLGERLVSLVGSVPGRRCLLHGDYHVGNVIVSSGVPTPIDMEHAGFGHPVFDLAIARSRTLGGVDREAKRLGIDERMAAQVARRLWNSQLEGYFEGADARELEELDRRIELLSRVEACFFDDGRLQNRDMSHMGRIAELLRPLHRLDF